MREVKRKVSSTNSELPTGKIGGNSFLSIQVLRGTFVLTYKSSYKENVLCNLGKRVIILV